MANANNWTCVIFCCSSNCMNWCGCQTTQDLTQIRRLRNECFSHYNTTYTRKDISFKDINFQMFIQKLNLIPILNIRIYNLIWCSSYTCTTLQVYITNEDKWISLKRHALFTNNSMCMWFMLLFRLNFTHYKDFCLLVCCQITNLNR